jgi:hypothetical protein
MRKEVDRMEKPFSRRFTLHEIWAYLNKKYPEDQKRFKDVSKPDTKRIYA